MSTDSPDESAVSVQDVAKRLRFVLDRLYYGNQSLMARELRVQRSKLRRSLDGAVAKPDLDLINDISANGQIRYDWLVHGHEPMRQGHSEMPAPPPPRAARVAPNAELVVMGAETVWVPLFPVSLGAGPSGDIAVEVEPEGALPIPASFARALGIVNGHVPFAVHVRGDSMRGELDEEAVALGYRTEAWEGDGIYALYLAGELLVKRVQRVRGGFELVSANAAYAPLPIETDEVRIIGRVKGALTRL